MASQSGPGAGAAQAAPSRQIAAMGSALTRTLLQSMLSILTALLTAVQLPPLPETPILLDGVTIVDVEAGVLKPNQWVLIRGETVAQIGARGSFAPPSGGVRILDATKLFLAPGLFDTHVHFVDPAIYGPAMVANGVLFARDLGSATSSALALRESFARGERLGPELIVVGAIVDGDPPVWPFSEVCPDAAAARAAVARLAEAGVDQIKVYSRLTPEAFHAAVAEAKARGLKVGGHVPNAVSLGDALGAGMDFSEHLMGFERLWGRMTGAAANEFASGDFREYAHWALRPQLDPAAWQAECQKIAASGCAFGPTLVVMEGIAGFGDPKKAAEDPLYAYVSPMMRNFWEQGSYSRIAGFFAQALPHQIGLVKDLHDAGATLVCGTDLANPRVFPGFSLHREMELFQQAGIPPAAVLRCATRNAAKLCGVDDRLGRVTQGGTASLVLLRANPLLDVKNYSQIESVILRGRLLERAQLDAMLADARQSSSGAPAAGDAAPTAAMTVRIPGAPVHQGRYDYKFSGQPAGHEDFLWTQDADGYHLQAFSETGSFSAPVEITAHYGSDRKFRSATWRRPDGSESAELELKGEILHVRGGKAGAEPQTTEIPIGTASIGVMMFSADWISNPTLGMNPGDGKQMTDWSFSSESWMPAANTFTLLRDPDAEVEWGGRKVTVSVYSGEYEMEGQKMKSRTWVGPDGMPIKSALALPFGKFEAMLMPPQ